MRATGIRSSHSERTRRWYPPPRVPGIESLLDPPIAFAHRGARAHAPENTLEAFQLALRLGATGLETDVWLTGDGVAVLDHDGRVKAGLRGPNAKFGLRGPDARFNLRRRPVGAVVRAELPASVPSLAELYAACGTAFELSVDVKDVAAAAEAVGVARAAGGGAAGRLWLCHPDWEVVAGWRAEFDDVRLVNSTRLKGMDRGPERRAAQLAAAGIDAVNLHYSDWTGGLTTLFHRFGRLAFGWDAQHGRMVRELARMGIDGVYSDHVDRMVEALGLAP